MSLSILCNPNRMLSMCRNSERRWARQGCFVARHFSRTHGAVSRWASQFCSVCLCNWSSSCDQIDLLKWLIVPIAAKYSPALCICCNWSKISCRAFCASLHSYSMRPSQSIACRTTSCHAPPNIDVVLATAIADAISTALKKRKRED